MCIQMSPMYLIEPHVSNRALIGQIQSDVSNTALICPIHPHSSKSSKCLLESHVSNRAPCVQQSLMCLIESLSVKYSPIQPKLVHYSPIIQNYLMWTMEYRVSKRAPCVQYSPMCPIQPYMCNRGPPS